MEGLRFVMMPQVGQRKVTDDSRRCYHGNKVHPSNLQCTSAEHGNFHRQGKGRKGGNENRHKPITLEQDVQPGAGLAPHVSGQQYLAALSGDFKQDQASPDRAHRCAKRGQIGLWRIVRRDRNQKGIDAAHDWKPSRIQNR